MKFLCKSWLARSNLICLALLLGLLILYVGLNTMGSFRFGEASGFWNYNDLAEALLDGQVHLKVHPDPQRASAAHPNDPSLPYPFVSDSVIFQGKYYFLQEPLPAIFHAMYLKLTGNPLPTGVVVILLSCGCLLWLGAIMWHIRRAYLPELPIWIFWASWVAFAMSGTQLYMVSRPVVYHEAIVAGAFCVMAGGSFFLFSLSANGRKLLFIVLSGFFFGAGMLCRVTLGLYPVCFLAFLVWSEVRREWSASRLFTCVFAFVVPLGCWATSLLIYNHFRFGDSLDFGRNYLIFPWHIAYQYWSLKQLWVSLAYVPHQLYNYLAVMPMLRTNHGIIGLVFPIELYVSNGILIGRERVGSIFLILPAIVLCFPSWFALRTRKRDSRLELALSAYFCSCLVMFAFLLTFCKSDARYLYDFTPLLFVLMFCNLAWIWDRVQESHELRRIFSVLLGLLLAAEAGMGLIYGFNGMVLPR